MDAGFLLPLTKFTSAHIPILEAALVEHQVQGCQAELNQFIQGIHVFYSCFVFDQVDDTCNGILLSL